MNSPSKIAKFLITGDIHFRSTNPVARKDIYMDAVLTKIAEIIDMAERYNVNAILVPGDLFDSASVSIPTIVRLGLALQSAPCPILTIPGNHDTFAHNLESLSRTPYGILKAFDFIRCVHESSWIFIDSVDGMVSGHGFNNETDHDLMQYAVPEECAQRHEDICRVALSSEHEYSPFYIHMAHGMLLDRSPGFDMRHTLVSRLAEIPKERQPHVLVCGHYHTGLAIQRVPESRTLVINPGALGRLSAHIEEMERPVQVALLTISGADESGYSAGYVRLRCAEPGHAVLSREHIEAAAAKNERLERFLALLASEGESKFLEVREIVEDIAAREQLPGEVKKEALRRIGEARERLGVGS
jgi:exonuclease SbcD